MTNHTPTTINLSGLRILNTRPLGEQNTEFTQQLTAAHGQVLSCPTLAILPTDDAWYTALPSLASVTHAIFVSTNAVLYFYHTLVQHKHVWPEHILVIAIGNSTARALQQHHIRVDFIPDIADSEHLLALDCWQTNHPKTILLIKGKGGRPLIAETLTTPATTLIEIDVYRRTMPTLDNEQLNRWWYKRAVDIILITSQQNLHNLFCLFATKTHAWLKQLPCLVISQRLAHAAAKLGMQQIIICSPETIIATLHQFNQGLTHD